MFIYSNISGSYSFFSWGRIVGAQPDPETRHSMLIGILPNPRTSSLPPTAHYKECNRDAEIPPGETR